MHSAFFCDLDTIRAVREFAHPQRDGGFISKRPELRTCSTPWESATPYIHRGCLKQATKLLRRRRRRLSRRRSRRLSTNDLELHIPTFAVVFRLADFHVALFYLRLECAGQ